MRNIFFKFLAFSAQTFCFTMNANATYYAFILRDNYVAFSSDSLSTAMNDIGKSTKEFCKIKVINSHNAFFDYGAFVKIKSGRVSLDAYDIAEKSFKRFGDENISLKDWLVGFTSIYGEEIKTNLSDISDLVLKKGSERFNQLFFINDNLEWAHAVTSLEYLMRKNSHVTVRQIEFTRNEIIDTEINPDISAEADAVKSARSLQMLSLLASKFGSSNEMERDALKVTARVQAMISWSGNPEIGGHPITIIVQKNKPLRWYARPLPCM